MPPSGVDHAGAGAHPSTKPMAMAAIARLQHSISLRQPWVAATLTASAECRKWIENRRAHIKPGWYAVTVNSDSGTDADYQTNIETVQRLVPGFKDPLAGDWRGSPGRTVGAIHIAASHAVATAPSEVLASPWTIDWYTHAWVIDQVVVLPRRVWIATKGRQSPTYWSLADGIRKAGQTKRTVGFVRLAKFACLGKEHQGALLPRRCFSKAQLNKKHKRCKKCAGRGLGGRPAGRIAEYPCMAHGAGKCGGLPRPRAMFSKAQLKKKTKKCTRCLSS